MHAAEPTPLTPAQSFSAQLAERTSQLPQVWKLPESGDLSLSGWAKPTMLVGTAATVTTAVLSLSGSVLQPTDTQTVPPAPPQDQSQIAQDPRSTDDQGCSAVCRDLRHTQAQMTTLRRYISERQVALAALQSQVQVEDPGKPAQAIVRRRRAAEIQQDRLTWEANQLRQELHQLNGQLGLSLEVSAVEVLNQAPDYQQLLGQWQQIDRQLGEVSEVTALDSPVWDPSQHDRPIPIASRDSLLSQHQQISSQLQDEMNRVALRPVQTLVPELESAIAENPLRLTYVKPWLTKAHRLQLVESRQQTLTFLVERLAQQQQIWQNLAQRQAFLQADLNRAEETLAAYAVQAQQLQNRLQAEQPAVSPPDVISASS